jgi:hypothetical protein
MYKRVCKGDWAIWCDISRKKEKYMYIINGGYSMLFYEYEIYFTGETEFLRFSRVRNTSENIIKNLVSQVK